MKKILLICNYYAPGNQIAAIRLTKFAKYLRQNGYDVQVLTEKKTHKIKDEILANDVDGIPVTYVENSKWMKRVDRAYATITKKFREKNYGDVSSRIRYNRKAKTVIFYPFEKRHPIIGTFDSLLKFMKNHNLYVNAKKYLKAKSKDIDICFSTYGSFFGHFAGAYIKRKNHTIRWITDYRDPVYQFNFDSAAFAPIAHIFEWWMWWKSDGIVVISEGMKKRVPKFWKEKTYRITNGYDIDDKQYLIESIAGDKFILSYTGSMYGGMRDVSKVFQVIRELIDEGIVNETDLEFRYAGTGFSVFKDMAYKYKLNEVCVDCGSVSRRESLQIQADSSLLLMATWEYQCQSIGVLTGKVLEYMLQEKPVIAIINGDVSGSELAHIIESIGIGVAYEQANDKRDTVKLKQYIKEQYIRYSDGQNMKLELDKDKLKEFQYPYLTQKLIHVFEEEI